MEKCTLIPLILKFSLIFSVNDSHGSKIRLIKSVTFRFFSSVSVLVHYSQDFGFLCMLPVFSSNTRKLRYRYIFHLSPFLFQNSIICIILYFIFSLYIYINNGVFFQASIYVKNFFILFYSCIMFYLVNILWLISLVP